MRIDPVFGEDGAPSTLADPGWATTVPPGLEADNPPAPLRVAEPASARDAPAPAPAPVRAAVGQATLVDTLRALLPAHALLWRNEDTTPYECDGLTAYRQRPLAVALPET